MKRDTEKELQEILAQAESSGISPEKESTDPEPGSAENAVPSSGNEPGNDSELVQQLREEIRGLKDQMLRHQADLENVRKRLTREKEEFLQFSLSHTVESLLPILDNFELALRAEGDGEEYRKGVELIYQQFFGALERLGLEPIDVAGQQFDPTVHEAIATVETAEYPEHQIVDEAQRGYFFKKRLLRPARVRVAKPPDDAEAQPSAAEQQPE